MCEIGAHPVASTRAALVLLSASISASVGDNGKAGPSVSGSLGCVSVSSPRVALILTAGLHLRVELELLEP
jgi:hypothetical protein